MAFGYTGSKLTSVTDKDGKSSTYTYGTNNLLTSAQDIDGYKLAYTYNTTTAGQPNRVATVKEYDGSTLGGELTIEYAHNQTTFTDHNGNKQISQFNNWGNTVSIQDGEGRARYGKYATDATDASASGKGNQLTLSSKLQNTVSNLLADGSFENGTVWTPLSGSASASVIASGISVPAYLGNKLLKVTGSAALNGMADGALSGVVSGAIAGGMAGYSNFKANPQCFVAGTLIKAENTDTPIENIKVGDYVWAWDEETGDVALKEVVETYINETDELVHVFVNGEEIITTPSHPFYSSVKGWTDAVHLRAGDILVLVNGEYVVVEKVQHEILESPVTVYNFQVEDYHTYYVSGASVLVHNKCNITENLSSVDEALDRAEDFLGPNYTEIGNNSGRFLSNDGYRQVRIDLTGHDGLGPHLNLETFKTPSGPGTSAKIIKDIHLFWQK